MGNDTYPCSPSIPRNPEKFPHLDEEVLAFVNLPLQLHTHIGIIQIAAGLQVRFSQTAKRLVRLLNLTLLNKPSG